MFDIFKGYSPPPLEEVRVETTTRCKEQCAYCPSAMFFSKWQEQDMDTGTFRRLSPLLEKTKLVSFAGWGDPLLNRSFFDMAAMARRIDCRVRLFTPGALIDDEVTTRLSHIGLEAITFPMSGLDKSNDPLRQGISQKDVLRAIYAVNRKRDAYHKPEIHVSYLLLRSELEKIHGLPELLKWQGIDKVTVRCLDYVPSPELCDEVILPQSMEEFDHILWVLSEVKRKGEEKGLDICFQLHRPGKRMESCTERGDRRIFVSASGEASPCTFTNLPVKNSAGLDMEDPLYWEKLSFGNINRTSPDLIWKSRPYRKFRRSFREPDIHHRCEMCPRLYTVVR